jgi:hypothetical protein
MSAPKRTSILAVVVLIAATTSASATGVLPETNSHVGPNSTCTSPSPCLRFSNGGKGAGVEGDSTKGSGVIGTTTAVSGSTRLQGVLGVDTSSNPTQSAGVTGRSTNGFGVTGFSHRLAGGRFESSVGNGLEATADNFGNGLLAASQGGVGVFAGGATGVLAFSNSISGDGLAGFGSGGGTGVYAVGGSAGCPQFCAAILAQPGTTGADMIEVTDSDNNLTMHLDYQGNLTIAGTLVTGGSCHIGCVTTGTAGTGQVVAYATREASPTIEDVGGGQLVGGQGYVRIDAAFARTMDTHAQYRVFLTPEGDSNGLFVTGKTPSGFGVRENRGGRSSLSFDYRIVAKPVDTDAARLPVWKAQPFYHAPRPVPDTSSPARRVLQH